ncbi:hypothetical protein ACFSQ3_09335 [Sphingobacterium corticis]|uniref:DUF3971 domain-containing protein n=1 Tax=Sphingobacterium corticis TaxID=1812823 RepID=A0ABW5NKB6_9SPHI
MKLNAERKPIDPLSKFWYKHSDQEESIDIAEQFSHVKVEAKETRIHVSLIDSESGSTSISPIIRNSVKHNVHNDTLFLKLLDKKANYLGLNIAKPLQSLTILNAEGSATFEPQLVENMKLNIGGQSEFSLNMPHRADNDTLLTLIPNLAISVSDKSKLYLSQYYIGKLDVNLQNGLLRYAPNLKVDTMNVQLVGKSALSSTEPGNINQVNVLNVAGKSDFFRRDMIGQDVKINMIQ